jgi:hypothetical protein
MRRNIMGIILPRSPRIFERNSIFEQCKIDRLQQARELAFNSQLNYIRNFITTTKSLKHCYGCGAIIKNTVCDYCGGEI